MPDDASDASLPLHATWAAGGEVVDLPARLAFLQLDDADRKRLQSLLPHFKASAEQFVETFYGHLFSFEESAAFLRDSEVLQRLKQLQQRHMESVLQADWNEQFVDDRRQVGHAHAERGIHPPMFLAAYYQFVQHVMTILPEGDQAASTAQHEPLQSILKAVFLDVGLTLESYFDKLSDDLKQAIEMVWKANDELRQFTRLASHDLKTPLGTVANLCDEVLDEFQEDIPAEAARLVETARQKAFQMSATIDELLTASMPNRDDVVDETVSCEEIIDDILDRLHSELAAHHIEVIVSRPLPDVLGNKVQVREAFYNLLSNAVKYIDKQPGRVAIHAEIDDSECVISVADNGPGIPPDETAHIFTAFRRLKQHANKPGTGLGLYFARSLIEHQGGRIWVESEPGRGSTFHVALRVGKSSA